MDWGIMGRIKNPGQAEQTIVTNGVNGKGRSARHFKDRTSHRREHGYVQEDKFYHRMHECGATAWIRERWGITPEVSAFVGSRRVCTRECNIWALSEDEKSVGFNPRDARTLWPTQQWLQALQQVDGVSGPVTCTLRYCKKKSDLSKPYLSQVTGHACSNAHGSDDWVCMLPALCC